MAPAVGRARFQSEPLTRLLLMSQPRGGLTQFDPEIPESDALLMCRVPIYGTKDAGRGFYLRMHGEIIRAGFLPSSVSPAMYYKVNEEMKLEALLCTHVDDLLFCHDGQKGKKTCSVVSRSERSTRRPSATVDVLSHRTRTFLCAWTSRRTPRVYVPSVWMREVKAFQ